MYMENELMPKETRDRIVPRVAVLLPFLLSLSLFMDSKTLCLFLHGRSEQFQLSGETKRGSNCFGIKVRICLVVPLR